MKDIELKAERAAFEAWWKGDLVDWQGYESVPALHAWEAWQARAAVEADRAQRVPECRVVDVGFRFDGEAQQHVPSIKVEFEPVPVNVGSGGKGWKDRDALAALLASTPAPAQQVDDTLEQKISSAATHAMTDFEVTNSIIYKCPALRLPQSFIQQLGMTAQIVVLKGATPEIAEFIAAACNEATESAARHQEPPQPVERKPMVDPCPGCTKGHVCRTPKCGRLALPVDHPLRRTTPGIKE